MGRRSREVSERRRTRPEPELVEVQHADHEHPCLVCRATDGGFTSDEHVFPESLGNQDLVLPKGLVCDRCNNGPLAVLDQTVCDFLPIKLRRTMLGISSKAGKIPQTRLVSGSVENIGPSALRIDTPTGPPILREVRRDGDLVELNLQARGGRRMTPRYASELSRAVLKSALECAWLDHGAAVLESKFDHLRDAILGRARDGYLLMMNTANPDDVQISLQYYLLDDPERGFHLAASARYFGITLATDSRMSAPAEDPPDEAASVYTFLRRDFRSRAK